MKSYKEIITELLVASDIGLAYDEILETIEIPPDNAMGDYAFPCFKLAKIKRNSPVNIAKDLSETISKPQGIAKIINQGPYLNFFIDRTDIVKTVIENVKEKGDKYGSSDIGKGKNAIVEYSSTNIAKPFHIGHIR